MKVIALRGPVNSGKSHTLNIVYQFLLRDGYTQVAGFFEILGNPKFEDVFDILEKNGKRVGVCGMGDYVIGGGSLKALLKRLTDAGCHVAVCSCQAKLGIEKAVAAYIDHVFVDKTASTGSANDRIVNGLDAQRMFILV